MNILLKILPFLVLVLVHHFLLEPLFHKKNKTDYFLLTAALIAGFSLYCFYPDRRPVRQEDMPAPPPGEVPYNRPGLPPADGKGPIRPETQEFIIGILLVAGDLGLTAIYRSRKREAQLKELQAANVSRQLETLRYQINPHFFMNTLNNIQSLVLTDPDKATEMINEFSKLMRIILYEGNEPTIPLARETEFLQHYLSLMRVRYPESVRIEADITQDTAGAVIPPLLYASFVENAFTHGISYDQASFVEISVCLSQAGRIVFKCSNSQHPKPDNGDHGLGLENVRERLNLLYGNDFILHIDEQPQRFDVLLDIPKSPSLTT